MASITKVGDSWRVLIRRKGHKTICKTFSTKGRASIWARKVEADIESGNPILDRNHTISDLIDEYRSLRETSRPVMGTSNEHYQLKQLEKNLGHLQAGKLTVEQLVTWAKYRKKEGAGKYTISMDLTKLGTVFKYASASLRINLPDVISQARILLTHLAIIGSGGKRSRRLSAEEVKGILGAADSEYRKLLEFAISSAMRRGEIIKLRWEDFNVQQRTILIHDRKDPRKKEGNNQVVPLLGKSFEILSSKPRNHDRIFPFTAEFVSDRFKEICDSLGIVDLHFHDLRHEAISRLFEQGYQIQEVALVSGHKEWRHLRRYTNLRPEDLASPDHAINRLRQTAKHGHTESNEQAESLPPASDTH